MTNILSSANQDDIYAVQALDNPQDDSTARQHIESIAGLLQYITEPSDQLRLIMKEYGLGKLSPEHQEIIRGELEISHAYNRMGLTTSYARKIADVVNEILLTRSENAWFTEKLTTLGIKKEIYAQPLERRGGLI